MDDGREPASEQGQESKDVSTKFTLCTVSAQISRDADVHLSTGMQNTDAFRTLFEYLLPKDKNMTYWKGNKQTGSEKPKRYADVSFEESPNFRKPGPQRKLKLEQELLLVMMQLCLAVCVGDLAVVFQCHHWKIGTIYTLQ